MTTQVFSLRRALYANGFQPIAVKTGEKAPLGIGWQMRRGLPPLSDAALNTGILCEGLCPADIDVGDADAVEIIVKIFDEVAGHSSLRRTRPNSSHCLLFYRAPDGTRPKKRVIKLGSLGKVELLGLGQQFVAYGMHPSGVEFEWPESGPDVVKREDMLVLAPEHEAEIERRLRATFDLPADEPAIPQPEPIATSRVAIAAPVHRPDIGAREQAYFASTLTALAQEVASTVKGGRNNTLNNAAIRIGHMVGAGWGSRSEVEAALTEAALACGLRQPAIGKTIASGLKAGIAVPSSPLDDREGYGDAAPDTPINLGGPKIAVVKGVPVDAETGEVIGEMPAPRDDYAADLMRWGGLVPEIARHILANSRRPQPTFAVMAALSVISVAAGRQMIAPLGSNLNLFVVLITRSANGKEAPIKLAPAILREAGLGVMVAPTGGFASDIGLYGWMHKHPVTVWPANEFGDKLAELTAKGNSPNLKKIIGALRELYDGGHIDSSEAALRNSVTLLNPCLSVLAASTPEQFFDVIGSKLIKDGTLNRFMAVYAPKRVRKQDPVEAELPQDIKDALMAIANRPGSLSSGRFYLGCCDQDPGKPYRIPWALDDAKARWDAYEDEIIDRSENDKMVDDLAGRCAQNALRVASLLAVSDDWQDPRVSLRHVEMGIRIADQSLADTIAGMRDYVPEGPGAALQEKIRQKIAAKGIITHRDLLRSMQKAVKNSKELADLLILMQEGGDIVKDMTTPEGGGTPTVFYQIRKDAA
jgi:hypothetical protein